MQLSFFYCRHIKQHMEEQIDISRLRMDQDAEIFYYFRMHDLNRDGRLDGIELIKGLTHVHEGINGDFLLLVIRDKTADKHYQYVRSTLFTRYHKTRLWHTIAPWCGYFLGSFTTWQRQLLVDRQDARLWVLPVETIVSLMVSKGRSCSCDRLFSLGRVGMPRTSQ